MRFTPVLAATLALAACASSKSSEEAPPPSDDLVYRASPETTRDVGVASWGFSTDGGTFVFHGYDGSNTPLFEVRETVTSPDDDVTHVEIEALDAKASLDISPTVTDGQVSYARTIVESSFTEGGLAARVLARVIADRALAGAGTKGGLLVQSIRPRDALLDNDAGTELIQCCSDLFVAQGQGAAGVGSCLLDGPSELAETGGGSPLKTQALVLGPDGQPVIKSPFTGPYNIADNHCHNAAAQNSSATDGYIACTQKGSTTSDEGHTINWAPDPSKKGAAGAYCAYEPQANGGTLLGGKSVCCWQETPGADGAPPLATPAARGCATKLCLGQASFDAGKTPPKAFPAGSKPLLPNDCPSSTNDLVSCGLCCVELAKQTAGKFKDADSQAQVLEFNNRCATGCNQREQARKASTSSKCMPNLQSVKGAADSAKSNKCNAKKSR